MNLFNFISGATAMAAWTCGLFFFRYWRKTSDRLFFIFGLAFWTMAIERVIIVFQEGPLTEEKSIIYLIRFAAFLMIIYAIYDKNRQSKV